MLSFVHDDFLLETDVACDLFHNFAKRQPVVEYTSHLPPSLIADDHRFGSITELWVQPDPQKWRVMRANGIAESFRSGDATELEQFYAWAQTVPYLLRHALYHWTHLELAFPFRITDCLLSSESAEEVFERCNVRLGEPAFSARGLLEQFNVRLVCTTDDPADALSHHERYQASTAVASDDEPPAHQLRMLPTFSLDGALAVTKPAEYNAYLDRLAAASKTEVGSFESLVSALAARHESFHAAGCRLSSSCLERMVFEDPKPSHVRRAFAAIRAGKALSQADAGVLQSAILLEMAKLDAHRGWVQQFHLGVMRRHGVLEGAGGADPSFDVIADAPQLRALSRFLSKLDKSDGLAKTLLHNASPHDAEPLAALAGSFQDGSLPAKVQYGGARWLLHGKDPIERQLGSLSNLGLLSRFVGVAAGAYTFLSFSRHEYFRRVLCNVLGNDVKNGLVPNDRDLLGWLVKRVCFQNARRFFDFSL